MEVCKKMICKCSSCGAFYEVKGVMVLDVFTHALECPKCHGLVNLIVARTIKPPKT